MNLSAKTRAAVAPTRDPGPPVTQALPIVRKARGIAYGVQTAYADWKHGMKSRQAGNDGLAKD